MYLTTVPDLMEFIGTDHPATDRFSMGPLKLLGDGALGARTAFLSHTCYNGWYRGQPSREAELIP